jgi:hypothetical protein
MQSIFREYYSITKTSCEATLELIINNSEKPNDVLKRNFSVGNDNGDKTSPIRGWWWLGDLEGVEHGGR